ncbi:outer membrane protein [Bradyrhizobium sp.]|uniref:outer membrane protein n=1 Tax=Bradyrhizobium sp. TaxID=376 RepID=UPI003C4AF023
MKRILLSTASLGVLGLLSPALAADLPYVKAPSATPSVYDWTGAYVGVFGGGGFGNHNVNNATGSSQPFIDFSANYSSQGGLAGGEAGYNWQSGSYIVGVEGDLFWSGIRGNDGSQFVAGAFPGVTAVDADNWRWGGTLRVRGGFTVDRWLMFFTGGYAFGDIQHTNTPPVGAGLPVDRFNVTANGLAAGGGIAYAITNNVSAKVEYRYYNFMGYNRAASTLTGFTPNGQLPYTTNSSYSVVSVGFDFKFGGPVVAKY